MKDMTMDEDRKDAILHCLADDSVKMLIFLFLSTINFFVKILSDFLFEHF